MGVVAILSFFVILLAALFIDGGFASGLGMGALIISLGVAMVGLIGLFNFIKHGELPDTFHPRTHDPHAG